MANIELPKVRFGFMLYWKHRMGEVVMPQSKFLAFLMSKLHRKLDPWQ